VYRPFLTLGFSGGATCAVHDNQSISDATKTKSKWENAARPRAADDFATIRSRMEELRRECEIMPPDDGVNPVVEPQSDAVGTDGAGMPMPIVMRRMLERTRISRPAGDRGQIAAWPDVVEATPIRQTRVVLAAAHLDHDPSDNRVGNLKSLCQRCHLLHNRPHRLARRITYLLRRALGDLFLGPYSA
jgi:hypothetical protein